MRKSLLAAQMLVRIAGAAQIILGLLIWFGIGASLVQLHTAIGGIFVLALWIVAVIALFILPSRGLAFLALIWGALVLWLGMAQTTLMLGSMHWIVRVVHLLVGLAAIGLGERLAAAVNRHRGWGGRGDRNTDAATS
jgi:hypothetical protein